MDTVGIPTHKQNTSERENNDFRDGNPLSASIAVHVSPELFNKAHFYVMQNTPEVVPYIE